MSLVCWFGVTLAVPAGATVVTATGAGIKASAAMRGLRVPSHNVLRRGWSTVVHIQLRFHP